MDFTNFDVWIWAPIGAGPLLAATAMFSYNQLSSQASRCNRAAADIDVQMQHCHSLLPNLLELFRSGPQRLCQQNPFISTSAKRRKGIWQALITRAHEAKA